MESSIEHTYDDISEADADITYPRDRGLSSVPSEWSYDDDGLAPEEEARKHDPTVQGYFNDELEDEIEWRSGKQQPTCYTKFIDTHGPQFARATLLLIACPLLLLCLIVNRFSLLSLVADFKNSENPTNETEAHKYEIRKCEVRAATFWAILLPILVQILVLVVTRTCTASSPNRARPKSEVEINSIAAKYATRAKVRSAPIPSHSSVISANCNSSRTGTLKSARTRGGISSFRGGASVVSYDPRATILTCDNSSSQLDAHLRGIFKDRSLGDSKPRSSHLSASSEKSTSDLDHASNTSDVPSTQTDEGDRSTNPFSDSVILRQPSWIDPHGAPSARMTNYGTISPSRDEHAIRRVRTIYNRKSKRNRSTRYCRCPKFTTYGVPILDGILTAFANVILVYSVGARHHWVWFTLQTMTATLLPNMISVFQTWHRACLRRKFGSSLCKIKPFIDTFAVAAQLAGAVLCVVFSNTIAGGPDTTPAIIPSLLPFVLHGGFKLLYARLERHLSPTTRLSGNRQQQRYTSAILRTFAQAATICIVVATSWNSTSNLFWADNTRCSIHNAWFVWNLPKLFNNRYMHLAIAHATASIAAIMLARFACSVRMNIIAFGIPLVLSTPVAIVWGVEAEKWLHMTFDWQSDPILADSSVPLLLALCMLYLGQLWCTKNILYEMSLALPREWLAWYQPLFDSVTLEQSLLLNRVSVHTMSHKRQSARLAATQLNSPSTNEYKPLLSPSDSTMSVHQSISRASSFRTGSSTPTASKNVQSFIQSISEDMDLDVPILSLKREEHHIVLATCMWHETKEEMRQWFSSLCDLVKSVISGADRYFISPTGTYARDTYEAHIVFDGAFERPEVLDDNGQPVTLLRRQNLFVDQLIEVINGELEDRIPHPGLCEKLVSTQRITEYGVVMEVDLMGEEVRRRLADRVAADYDRVARKSQYFNKHDAEECVRGLQEHFVLQFRLFIHLKDPLLSKPGKRKNQVLYMNFVNGLVAQRRRDERKGKRSHSIPPLHRTFMMTTDGDTCFSFRDVDHLVDALIREEDSVGVCGRIRPIGSGVMVPYQKFEYAMGHYLQKATESVMGTVLCCPGCFSMWRMSKLNDVLEHYSLESSDGGEYLRKDQGEDRWMCTLLIRRGWRMGYCAAAVGYTFCPSSFDEFFDQRRRWLSSTLANMWDLMLAGAHVARQHGSSVMPLYYRMYIFLNFWTSILTPATIVLLVAGGLQMALSMPGAPALLTAIALPTLFIALLVWQQILSSASGRRKVRSCTSTIISCCCCCRQRNGIVNELEATQENDKAPTLAEFRGQQIWLCRTLSIAYLFLFGGIAAGIAINAVNHFWGAENVFFLCLAAVFAVTILLHPRDLPLVFHGLLYFMLIPMGYLILFMYAAANMNVMSWGTRSTPPPPNRFPAVDILVDPIAEAIYARKSSLDEKRARLLQALSAYLHVAIIDVGNVSDETLNDAISRNSMQLVSAENTKNAQDASSDTLVDQNMVALLRWESGAVDKIAFSHETCHDLYLALRANPHELLLTSSGIDVIISDINMRRQTFLQKMFTWGSNIREHVCLPESVHSENWIQSTNGSSNVHPTTLDMDGAVVVSHAHVNKQKASEDVSASLNALRNKCCLLALGFNVWWPILVAILALNPEIELLDSNIAGLVFLALCSVMIIIQFLCMLKHRWDTFLIYVSSPLECEAAAQRALISLRNRVTVKSK